MQEKQKILSEISFINSLKALAEVYEEISIMRIQRIKTSVLKTRNFLDDLSKVFFDVKNSYRNMLLEIRNSKITKNTPLPTGLVKNGKEVSVFLSANTKLYGDIVPKIFSLFMDQIRKRKSDIVICGKLGKDMFDQKKTDWQYTYFDIPDTDVSFEDLKQLISYILNYQKIIVFYGKFVNIINQIPIYSNISGEEPFDESQAGKEETQKVSNTYLGSTGVKFLFEPSVERIFDFFQTQILTSLFKQTVHESQLSRYASRIDAMEEALENISSRLRDLKNQEKKINRAIQNKKQAEAISGISLWGTS